MKIVVAAAVAAAAALGFGTTVAHANECSTTIIIAPDVDEEMSLQLRDVINARDDVDPCARIKVSRVSKSTTYSVEATLTDGRATTRLVSRREDVAIAALALLLVPRAAAAASTPKEEEQQPPAPPPPPTPIVDVKLAIDQRSEASPPSTVLSHAQESPSHLRVELSVLSGARIGDDQASVGLGMLSFVEGDGWLAGLGARAEYFQQMSPAASASSSPGQQTAAVTLAALGGRRFRHPTTGSVAFDLYLGPAIAVQGSYASSIEAPGKGLRLYETGPSAIPRAVIGARVSFRARSTLRAFIGLDGDFGPRRASSGDDTDEAPPPPNVDPQIRQWQQEAPRLPLWSVGIALGATVGSL